MKNSGIIIFSILLSIAGCKRETPRIADPGKAVVGLETGNQAPDLAFNSIDEHTIQLSSLRGKMVLVDFWASWCMPCRIENPNLVKVYSSFKNKKFVNGDGFTIYSISLDTNKKSWKEAIEKDGLVWEAHVSDLKGWYSVPAAICQVTSIPANLLLDGNGIIIAKNLRAESLERTIKSLLK